MSKPDSRAAKSSKSTFITLLLLVIIGGGVVLMMLPSKPVAKPELAPPPAADAKQTDAPVAPSADLGAVVGDWLREDGGYQLKLTRDVSGNKLNAAYFNPNPINVSYCSATNEGGAMKVRVELNDTGYPGCVYSLIHDRASDRLLGTYYQAAMGETYEVMFVRTR
jgi:hypothetical protein